MDSGNSGSLQSSSGGDDEYDSRAAADSISAFMNNPISNNQPPPQPPPPFYDPFSNYLNPNMAWPGNTLRSYPNPIPPFTPSFQTTASFGIDNNNNNNHATITTATTPHNQNQTAAAAATARNPKKRSRASRRAPTTVLTTDTNNFRAMVQEFTGIPAPPFNNSPFTRTRFDLFTGGIGSTTTTTTDAPPYLRRPFAQKVQSPLPFFTSTTSSGNSNYHQLQIPQNSNVFNNIQNPILTSLLQANPKFPYSSNPAIMASKSLNQNSFQIPSNEFSLSNDQDHASTSINGLQTLISSDHQIAMRNVRSDNDPVNRDENNNDDDDDRVNITMNGVQMNYSASSNFNGEKLTENIRATKGEGMVESWICSSSE